MMGRDGSGNILAPSLTLKLNLLLQNFPVAQQKDELTQVTFLILRHISNLRRIYHFYCTLGHNRVQSTKSEMTRLQFWRFVKDSQLHHHGISVPEMDRVLARCLEKSSVHQPTERLSLSDFLTSITILGYVIYKDKIHFTSRHERLNKENSPVSSNAGARPKLNNSKAQSYILAQCLQKLLTDHIMQHIGRVKGEFLFDPRKAINALSYMEGSWKIYRSLCNQQEQTIVMRTLLLALNDLNIIGPHLSSENVLQILASDNPNVHQGGSYNLEIEITFLEYFEVLVGCAMSFVNQEMLQQPANFGAPKLQRRHNTSRRDSRSGLGHSRPGSAYSRHTSTKSSRTASRKSSVASISSITEDIDTMEEGDEASTVKSDEGTLDEDLQEMETVVSGIDELHIGESEEQSNQPKTQSKVPPVLLPDDDDEDEIENASLSARSKGSTPEISASEMQEKESQFQTWSSKLHIFFTRHLFPSWQRMEMLRREAAKHRGRKMYS